MPAEPTLPTPCPQCGRATCNLVLTSRTVLTVMCPACRHMWAIDLDSATEAIRQQTQLIILERDFSGHRTVGA